MMQPALPRTLALLFICLVFMVHAFDHETNPVPEEETLTDPLTHCSDGSLKDWRLLNPCCKSDCAVLAAFFVGLAWDHASHARAVRWERQTFQVTKIIECIKDRVNELSNTTEFRTPNEDEPYSVMVAEIPPVNGTIYAAALETNWLTWKDEDGNVTREELDFARIKFDVDRSEELEWANLLDLISQQVIHEMLHVIDAHKPNGRELIGDDHPRHDEIRKEAVDFYKQLFNGLHPPLNSREKRASWRYNKRKENPCSKKVRTSMENSPIWGDIVDADDF